jgi:hypothetical protein
MVENWSEYIPYKHSMLRILENLSSIYSRGENFVIIGGFSLLVNCYLKFPCLWDIDILVPSEDKLRKILSSMDFEVEIIHEMSEDDFTAVGALVKSEDRWINVDVLVKDLFPLYNKTKIIFEGRIESYELRIPLGHPYAVLVDKVLTSRFAEGLERRDPLVYDVRHVGLILTKDVEKEELWNFLKENLKEELRDEFLTRLRQFVDLSGLGYIEEEIKEKLIKRLSEINYS